MCLTLYIKKEDRHKSKQELSLKYRKRANKDITTYKVLVKNSEERLLSLFRGKKYDLNSHYYQVGSFDKQFSFALYENTFSIYIGLHSYKTLSMAKIKARYSADRVIIKCTIPKGSWYYINAKHRELVSNNLILHEIIS